MSVTAVPQDGSTVVGYNVPLTAFILAPAVLTDIVQLKVPFAATIVSIETNLQALTSGTLTGTLKNDAGGTLSSLSHNAAGPLAQSISTAAVAANDHIHLNLAGVGVGAVWFTVTIWLRLTL